MSFEEARTAARKAYGGIEQAKQLHRNERSYPGLARTLQDTRSLRHLRKSPVFTLTAVLMLGWELARPLRFFQSGLYEQSRDSHGSKATA